MRLTISLSEVEIKLLKARAKKNLLSLKEQIEDIVRRSCVSAKRKQTSRKIKIDDKLVGVFSRHKRKKKKK